MTACCATGLNDAFSDAAFGLAHRRPGGEISGHPRSPGPLGAALAAAFRAARRPPVISKRRSCPVEVPGKKGPTQFDKDEHNRPDTTLEALARLKPAFRPNGTITAGNAPGLNDAAAAMVLADETWAEKRGLAADGAPRLLRHCGGRARDVRPRTGPGGQASACSAPDGRSARSSASRSTRRSRRSPSSSPASSDCPTDIVNVEGGAVAHGHPIGATGAVLTTQAHPLDAPRRPQARHRHALHRRRPRHRARDRSAALNGRSWTCRSRWNAHPRAAAR